MSDDVLNIITIVNFPRSNDYIRRVLTSLLNVVPKPGKRVYSACLISLRVSFFLGEPFIAALRILLQLDTLCNFNDPRDSGSELSPDFSRFSTALD